MDDKQTFVLFCGNEVDIKIDASDEDWARPLSELESKIYIDFDGKKYQLSGKPIDGDTNLYDYCEEAMDEVDGYGWHCKTMLKSLYDIHNGNGGRVHMGNALEDKISQLIADETAEKVANQVYPEIEKRIFEHFGFMPERHEIIMPDKTVNIVDETTHEIFDTVLTVVSKDIGVFLSGSAGTGKNVICKQVAKALNLEFYFTNAVTQEYQLKGFIDANGKYHETQFYQAFTRGGLFFLDEMDASIPETLTMLNAALANKYFDFPIGRIDAHPDFRVIAAGNTIGLGANAEYTGRFQLDAASLDRFLLIYVGYSPKIEMSVSKGNEDLCKFARTFRQAADRCGIKCLFTYRAISRIATLEGTIDNLADIIQMSVTKGLRKDDVHILNTEIKSMGLSNKYTEAMVALENAL